MGTRSLRTFCTKFQNSGAGSRLVLISSVSHFLKVCSHSINMILRHQLWTGGADRASSPQTTVSPHLDDLTPAWLQGGVCLQSPGPHPGAVDNHIHAASCHLAARTRQRQEGVRTLQCPLPSVLQPRTPQLSAPWGRRVRCPCGSVTLAPNLRTDFTQFLTSEMSFELLRLSCSHLTIILLLFLILPSFSFSSPSSSFSSFTSSSSSSSSPSLVMHLRKQSHSYD